MAFVSLQGGNIATKERLHRLQPIKAIQFALHPLYHSKNRNNRKIESLRRRGKRREPLPYNVFKMVTDFRGRRELGGILVGVYKMADMVQPVSLFVRPFEKVNQSGELRCFQ